MHVDCGASAAEGASKDGCSGFVVAQWGGVVVLNGASSAVTTSIRGVPSNTTGAPSLRCFLILSCAVQWP